MDCNFVSSTFFRNFAQNINNMALYREQLEPHMYSEKARRHKSYKWAKKQMNKWLRIKNKKINADDAEATERSSGLVGNGKKGIII